MSRGFRATLVSGSKKDWKVAMELRSLVYNSKTLNMDVRRAHFLMLDHQSSELKANSSIVYCGWY